MTDHTISSFTTNSDIIRKNIDLLSARNEITLSLYVFYDI